MLARMSLKSRRRNTRDHVTSRSEVVLFNRVTCEGVAPALFRMGSSCFTPCKRILLTVKNFYFNCPFSIKDFARLLMRFMDLKYDSPFSLLSFFSIVPCQLSDWSNP